LPGRWKVGANPTPPETSLLHKLLEGIFRGDDDTKEKANLLSEICGVAALGYATKLMQPRAVIFWGRTAENGKSQILDMARGLVSSTAICCVPASKMGDERHIVGLVAKLLNATDELSSAHAIASDKFKSVVTGEPIDGRDVYTKRVEFRSMAQNIHATNTLPSFQGGMDRGVQRRLLLLVFNRTIPEEERIELIGQRIAAEEADLLLAWAVAGASCAVKNRNFTIPKSCKAALDEWIYSADPVLAWIHQCVKAQPVDEPDIKRVRTRDAHADFKFWAKEEGFNEERLPELNGFTQRVTANAAGVEYKRTADGRWFERMIITSESQEESQDAPEFGGEHPF